MSGLTTVVTGSKTEPESSILDQPLAVSATPASVFIVPASSDCADSTESLRRELSGSGVQIPYIAPRATLTDLNSDNIVAMNNTLGTAMDHPSLVADEGHADHQYSSGHG